MDEAADLATALEELKQAQARLVEREKLAALGGLVAGVAHEINTPIGIAVTAASHLREEALRIRVRMMDGSLRKSDLLLFEQGVEESTNLILTHLSRAAGLVRSFKQIASDQAIEDARQIEVYEYLHDILSSLAPSLKGTGVIVDIECPEPIVIRTCPGALVQIVSNLVLNSLIHAFEEVESPRIDLKATQGQGEWFLEYRDNGCGMSEQVRARAFEPFFTTRRGQGGTGLGLHIVYSLVTRRLRGSVDLQSSPGEGLRLVLSLPEQTGDAAGE